MEDQEKISNLTEHAIALLQKLIETPSVSRSEDGTAAVLQSFLSENGVANQRIQNNIFAVNKYFNEDLPTLLLNSHHDTVSPNKSYTNDPFKAIIHDGKIYGLGSNDAGGALVSLLAAFLFYHDKKLPFNIIFAASAEEEISGKNGMDLLLRHLPKPDMAIVGEPTEMRVAVAEKGLLVIDGVSRGIAGHAARDEGENAIYKFVRDVDWIENYSFEKVSPLLGPVHAAVTVVETQNKSHNVVPDECRFVIDIRVNEMFSFEAILEVLHSAMKSELTPRSLRLKPSLIKEDHPLVVAAKSLGMECFGSPTLSDMALMNFPAVKCGPGDSARSHTADEFIFLEEIAVGIEKYIDWISSLETKIFGTKSKNENT